MGKIILNSKQHAKKDMRSRSGKLVNHIENSIAYKKFSKTKKYAVKNIKCIFIVIKIFKNSVEKNLLSSKRNQHLGGRRGID